MGSGRYNIILKYYKIILFLYIFFTLQPNPRQPSKPWEPINHNLNNLINSPDQQPRQLPITPATTPASPNPPQPISIKINKITNRTQPQPCYPTIAKESIGEAELVRRFFDCGLARSPQLQSARAGPTPRSLPSSRPHGHHDLFVHRYSGVMGGWVQGYGWLPELWV